MIAGEDRLLQALEIVAATREQLDDKSMTITRGLALVRRLRREVLLLNSGGSPMLANLAHDIDHVIRNAERHLT